MCTQKRSLELRNYQSQRLVLDLHALEEGADLGHQLEVVLEQFRLEHGVEVLGSLLALLG